jgi:D-alanine-D-alanine ligase
MRLDAKGGLYILETNSLPSLASRGSYLVGAAQVGLDFTSFVNRLVDVATARYFGTPAPPVLNGRRIDTRSHAVGFVTQRREAMERRLREWVALASPTWDRVGIEQAVTHARDLFGHLGMTGVGALTDPPHAWAWETRAGLDGGTLLVAHVDVPTVTSHPHQPYRSDPEWLHGQGVGTSRAPLVMIEFALRALRSIRRLRRLPLGVLLYADEDRDAQDSAAVIRAAAGRARRVIVLRPGMPGEGVILQRRGNRRFQLRVAGEAVGFGRASRRPGVLPWTWDRLAAITQLGSPRSRSSVSVLSMETDRHPMRLPHRVTATLVVTYPDVKSADRIEERMRALLGKNGPKWELVREADRPPMRERPINTRLFNTLSGVAEEHGVKLKKDTSAWASVAGLVPSKTAAVCGFGPTTKERGTPQEAVLRIALVQHTLLLADFLARELEKDR